MRTGIKDVIKTITAKPGRFNLFHLNKLDKIGLPSVERLPFAIKILLENALRNYDNYQVSMSDIKRLAEWRKSKFESLDVAFKPGRVILQDFTGVPCVVDLAAMRAAVKNLGGDYRKINPQVACDLVIDHSLQVDAFGSNRALEINEAKEFQRNKERYAFLKWGQNVFKNFRVVPPSTGIIHQVNLEYLAKGVLVHKEGKIWTAYPDSLVGTDSHTTMINGLGVVGWGVGGIEAEAVMLGEPISMLLPDVIGFKLTGELKEGVTATDAVLTITQILRRKGVVGKFVEFFGPALAHLSLPDRATIANMAPEYGATMGLFPVDEETLAYYRMTGRSSNLVDLIERYMKEQGLFYSQNALLPEYSEIIELDLSAVVTSLAGPKRPQDRVPLEDMQKNFRADLIKTVENRGFGLTPADVKTTISIGKKEKKFISHGAVAIASITSCLRAYG